MKKIIFASLAFLYCSIAFSQAQIDRTKQPTAGSAPKIKFSDPEQFTLPNGLTVLVVENHKLPKVSASLVTNIGPIKEGKKVGSLSLMGSMLNEGTKNLSKAQFDEKVDLMGAQVSLNSGGGQASALTRYFESSVLLMADALLHPAMTLESFDKLKTNRIAGLKASEKDAKTISSRVVNALAYGKETAKGEFETIADIEALTLDDINDAYKNYLSPANGILTFVGDITLAQAKTLATKAFGSWIGKKIPLSIDVLAQNSQETEIDLVDLPSAVQSEISLVSLIENPYSSPDYHALVLANQILGGGAESKLFMNLREKHGFTYGSYSRVGSGLYQTLFNAGASVRNDKVDSAVAEIINEVNNMRAGKINDEEIAIAKAVYNGSFARQMENPQTPAIYASTILINKLPKDYYRTFLQKINAVTAADIARVAQKYFNDKKARIVVVGKASVTKPGLEKLGYPLKTYDAFASAVTNSHEAAPVVVDKNLTGQSVIDKYIAALGGKDAVAKVKSLSSDISMSINGQTLTGIMKNAAPNKFLMQLGMNGMTVVKRAFNGTDGYEEQMGQKKNMDADEIKIFSDVKGVIPQLFYSESGFKISPPVIEKVNGEDAYKIVLTKPSGNTATEFYSVNSGLLLKEESVVKAMGQEIPQTTEYGNYTTTAGIKFPSEMTQTMSGQSFTIKSSNYKVNEDVSDSDFN